MSDERPSPRLARATTTRTSHSLPPSYFSGSAHTPSYHRNPRPHEHVLAHGQTRTRHTGTFTHQGPHISLSLGSQEEGCAIPLFGRAALVEGTITLAPELARSALKLQITIQADLKLSIAEGGTITHSILSHTIPLFYSASPAPCPETHSFAYRLPVKFDDGGTQRPLPPTYDVAFSGVPGLTAAVRYSFSIKFVRKKVWKRKEMLSVPFKYHPRARPPQPILGMDFLSSLKSHPEEWSLFSSTVAPRFPTADASVVSSFILPSTSIYPMSRKIPFHLQLSLTPTSSTTSSSSSSPDPQPLASSSSAPAFLASNITANHSEGDLLADPSIHLRGRTAKGKAPVLPLRSVTHPSSRHHHPPPTLISPLLTSGARVRVTLQRQISVDVRSQKVLKTIVCGEGFVRRVRLSGADEARLMAGDDEDDKAEDWEEDDQDWAGWEGEVVPSNLISVGGFRAAGLSIRDFIILNLVPPDPHTSPLRAHQHAVPVRIVTDAWEGEDDGAGF